MNARRKTTSKRCSIKHADPRLVTYLSKEDSVKTLLQWVISGLDKLDEEAVLADSACYDQVAHNPSFQLPDSPSTDPVDDAFLASIQDIALERQSSRDSSPSR